MKKREGNLREKEKTRGKEGGEGRNDKMRRRKQREKKGRGTE